MEVKFLWNGIKVDGKLYPAHYSFGGYIEKYPKETIGIYGKRYRRLPEIDGLSINNGSNVYTDYFENDRIMVLPSNPHYPAVLAAHRACEAHYERLREKKRKSR